MKLLTKAIRDKLLKNGRASLMKDVDHTPVVKFFNPCGAATWLITEMDPENPDILFGLCDLGMGSPEMGSVSLSELQSVHGPLGIGIERDLHFKADKTLRQYAEEAYAKGRIVA